MIPSPPENAVRKGIQSPKKAIHFIKTQWLYSIFRQIHLGLKSSGITKQIDKLAEVRREPNFCLIVLDACRYDVLKDHFDDYFTGDIIPTKTPATNTFDYQQFNWAGKYNYPYITAATPVTSEQFDFDGDDAGDGLPQDSEQLYQKYRGYIPSDHFRDLEEVWRDGWDPELRVCPPEPVTSKAIERANNAQRIVAHYFQPHAPYIGEERPNIEREESGYKGSEVKIDADVWPAVRKGKITKKELRRYYSSNLDRVLAAAAKLIRKTDFDKYVITGDHGEALGEYGQYAHSVEHPYVNIVPWCTVDSVKKSAREMWEYSSPSSSEEVKTSERLKDLGYLE